VSSLAAVRRRRTALMLGTSLVVVAAVGGLLYAGGLALARYQGAKDASVNAEPIPSTEVGLLALVDGEQQLTGLTVFVGRPENAPGGNVVSVPISSDTTGGLGEARSSLADAFATGGQDGLVAAVESVLSVSIDHAQVASVADLALLLQPVSPVKVTLPRDVMMSQDGAGTLLYSAGEVSLSAGQVATVLTARSANQTEADRRPNVEAVWSAVAAAIGKGVGSASTAPPTSFGSLAAQVMAGPVGARGVPARTLPRSEVPVGKDIEELDRAEAVYVFATIAPSNMSAPSNGLVFRVEAPPGHAEKVKYTVSALLYLGANVQWVYENGPEQATTKVYLADKNLEDDALGAEGLFGTDFEQLDSVYRIEGIDVILQLGTSFLTDPASGNTLPSTTTTTTVP